MSYLIPDPIYGTIELDSSLETLFRIPALATEKRRLERIKSLGLIHISFPSATHSKWEHHLGMAHLAGQISLNKDNKKRLQILCLLGGIGHLPYTYATEAGVLLASRLSATFRSSLEGLMSEVWQTVADQPDDPTRAPYKRVIDAMNVIALHGWLTALKIKRLDQDIDLGDRKRLVKDRVDGDAELNRLYRFVARVDYVQRDLYYTGLARFSLSAHSFLRRYQGAVDELFSAPASKLIDQIRNYLADSLYFEVRSATIEALFAKRLASMLLAGTISVNDLLGWHDHDLDSTIEEKAGKPWWRKVLETPYTEICRARVVGVRMNRGPYGSRDTFALEQDLAGIADAKLKSMIRYPDKHNFTVLCKESYDPIERAAVTDVMLSTGNLPSKITPIAEAMARLEAKRQDRWVRRQTGTRRTLGEDLIGFIVNASLHSDFGGVSRVFAAGVNALPVQKQRTVKRILNEYYYYAGPVNPTEAEFWDQFLSSSQGPYFLDGRPKWVGEILRAAARASRKDLPDIIEVGSWVAEHSKLHRESVKWIVPNLMVGSDTTTDQIDVCSIHLRDKTTIIRFIECTKSDSENKAVDDLEKLEKIKTRCRRFDDLVVEQLVYGASKVRDHFASVQQLLGQFKIRT